MKCAKFEESWIKTGPRSSHICSTGVFKHHPRLNQKKRESVVDSGTSKNMLSRKDFNSAELETVRVSRNTTTFITASGEVQTNEDATRDLDLFLTVQLLEDTPPTIFRGHFREDQVLHGVDGRSNTKYFPQKAGNYIGFLGLSSKVSSSGCARQPATKSSTMDIAT